MKPEEMTDKQTIVDVLSRLPDDASLEDVRDEFEMIWGILESMRDADAGGMTFSHEEVMEDIRRCRQRYAGRSAAAGK
jgi:hypothetical protein